MEEESTSEEPKISKYNSAMSQIYRLDAIWQKALIYMMNGKLMNWNWTLDCIWSELCGDALDKDIKEYYSFHKLIVENRRTNRLYLVLQQKDLFLRKLQNTQGKGTLYRDASEEDIEE